MLSSPGCGNDAFVRGRSEVWWSLERPGLTLPVPVDPTGARGPTRGQARGPRWRTTSRGLFVPDVVSRDLVEQRIVEAAAVLPPGTAVTGWAALRWAGGAWFDGLGPDGSDELPVTLAIGDSTIGRQSGFEISEEHLRPYDLDLVDGLPVTTAERSVTYVMRHAESLLDAVIALDMACYNDLVSVAEVAAYLPTMPAWTGIQQCRTATALANENAWSPREVGVRVTWERHAKLPRLLVNQPVFDGWGRHIGTPDLLDEEAGVVIEYDGALHLAGAQRRRDRDREEAFRRVGLEYLTVMAGDPQPHVVARMQSVRRRAQSRQSPLRDWTTELPAWWVPTSSVNQRRSLDHAQRDRLLRLRRTA